MCLSKVAALCYRHRDAQYGQGNVCDGVSFTLDAQTRSQGLVEVELPYETDGYRRLSAGV